MFSHASTPIATPTVPKGQRDGRAECTRAARPSPPSHTALPKVYGDAVIRKGTRRRGFWIRRQGLSLIGQVYGSFLSIKEGVDVPLQVLRVDDGRVVPVDGFSFPVNEEFFEVPMEIPDPKRLVVQTRREVRVCVFTAAL